MLEIKNLSVSLKNQKPILQGLSLSIPKGKIHAIMGPNGTGKSTLAKVLAGHPSYQILSGEILFEGKNLSSYSIEERALLGIFIGFQYPLEISGIENEKFLHAIFNAKRKFLKLPPFSEEEFDTLLDETMAFLDIKKEFKKRSMNQGFSGGEKKRNELLQMALLNPSLAILDEIDSGLDIDALKGVAHAISSLFRKNSPSLLLITHYPRILEYIKPDAVHILIGGKIVKSGDLSLALKLEKQGYDWLKDNE